MLGAMKTVGLAYHKANVSPDISDHEVFASIENAVKGHYRLVKLSPWFPQYGTAASDEAGAEFLSRCDIVITTFGLGKLLRTRVTMPKRPPVLYLPLGEIPRGARSLRAALPWLDSGDVVAVTCTADRMILSRLLAQCPAAVELLPFGIDIQLFAPLPETQRRKVRAYLGFAPDDVVFLYAGRIIPEKNVQATVAVLGDVAAQERAARLIVVGKISPIPLREFGPARPDFDWSFAETILRPPASLAGRYVVWPHRDRSALPELYGAADVFVNMTLHHDENFGYSQVEAMACGLPVVGTDWGGLKDSILDGRTGFQIPTMLTEWGVVVDRLAAVRRCAGLAASPEARAALGAAGRKHAVETYDREVFARRLLEILNAMTCPANKRGAPGTARAVYTAFGERYNAVVPRESVDDVVSHASVPAARGVGRFYYTADTYDLYADYIQPYCSGRAEGDSADDDTLFLAPLLLTLREDILDIQDFLWPQRVALDAHELALVQPFLETRFLSKHRLRQAYVACQVEDLFEETLKRLITSGIIARSHEKTIVHLTPE